MKKLSDKINEFKLITLSSHKNFLRFILNFKRINNKLFLSNICEFKF
jgi:hypothetical protein